MRITDQPLAHKFAWHNCTGIHCQTIYFALYIVEAFHCNIIGASNYQLMKTSLVSIPSVLELHKQTWMNKQLVTQDVANKKTLCDTCVKPIHLLSYIYIRIIYNLPGICSFPSLLLLTCTRFLVYISIFVLNKRLATLLITCGWIFLCTNPKSFTFILDMISCVCCAFFNHKKIAKGK